ncbi:hypothetical protein B0T24DRAFT_628238 [Lasiosphaeria ovina]|uniref:Uncharacterized protein n=1 Tax=Lasiosphaeria ovina TaxID=92902 RepID=A0AAE0K7V2_9PEZI|nr:hypothetical protein B0T24DRAFT_628238 [Lasiosphaeria ovina]
MEALKHLATNMPDWLKRLGELGGQIAKRQRNLAQLIEPRMGVKLKRKHPACDPSGAFFLLW